MLDQTGGNQSEAARLLRIPVVRWRTRRSDSDSREAAVSEPTRTLRLSRAEPARRTHPASSPRPTGRRHPDLAYPRPTRSSSLRDHACSRTFAGGPPPFAPSRPSIRTPPASARATSSAK
ncbi:MAG: hypothetical protein H6721_05730 [Sandaracinus sp.]|nr:hypothetical protein [Sandaracinus sp.]